MNVPKRVRVRELSIIEARSLNEMMNGGFVNKLYRIKVSHPYLYYPLSFRKRIRSNNNEIFHPSLHFFSN